MDWFVGILIFISSVIAIFTSGLFIISCLNGIINPNIVVTNGEVKDANQNSRLIFLIIASIAWALVITLS